LDAWRKAGLPVVTDRRAPIELQRQVQIGAGGMAFFGTLLGLTVTPWFFGVPLFVGGGLMVAGLTGFCGMAQLLMRAPWNRAVYGTTVRTT
jgi:prolipoprotein diacylglyceryltransferase